MENNYFRGTIPPNQHFDYQSMPVYLRVTVTTLRVFFFLVAVGTIVLFAFLLKNGQSHPHPKGIEEEVGSIFEAGAMLAVTPFLFALFVGAISVAFHPKWIPEMVYDDLFDAYWHNQKAENRKKEKERIRILNMARAPKEPYGEFKGCKTLTSIHL